ncbi:MAG: hypothetical protein J5602_07595 [Clostridia bacterium]|nr:hypothetical protein [Clostridia bacterium]MBO4885161.1 hypothetical protein [Clostridia bacterium]
MGGLTPWAAAAALGVLAAALAVALLVQRWRMRALAARIEDFLSTGGKPLAFSVREDSLAPLHNAASELENRVMLAREHLAEEERRASALTADISHQLKTPLASLKLFCELDGGAHMEEEIRQIERMERLIQSLLRLERLCADGYEFTFAWHDAEPIVRAAWDSLAPVFPGRRLEIEGAARIRCDAKWMGEAFLNMLKNACEHTKPGGAVRVSLQRTEAAFFCEMEDDGGGAPPGDLRRLFERFYRAPGQETEGAGIGLAIVREIIERHHGSIRAENGRKGLKLIIDMPMVEKEQ